MSAQAQPAPTEAKTRQHPASQAAEEQTDAAFELLFAMTTNYVNCQEEQHDHED